MWWKSTQGFLRYRVYEVKIAYLDQVHWPLTLSGSRPKSNQFIYSSWCTPVPSLMKIHPGVLEISCLEVKIAYLDQVYWPLTLGGSRPKSNQFIYSSWCIPGSSMIKIHQGVLEISCLRDSRTDGRTEDGRQTTRKHNASGALRVGGIKSCNNSNSARLALSIRGHCHACCLSNEVAVIVAFFYTSQGSVALKLWSEVSQKSNENCSLSQNNAKIMMKLTRFSSKFPLCNFRTSLL